MTVRVARATLSDDAALCAIAKQHKHTKDFCSILFIRRSIEELYAAGGIGKATQRGKVVGFVCSKHLIRKPYTSIYYMGVDEAHTREGIGLALIDWTFQRSPHNRIQLICEDINKSALEFYASAGFRLLERGATKSGKTYQRLELA